MQRGETWTETYHQLVQADREHALEPKDLETLALSAYLTGRDSESYKTMERAHQGFLESGNLERSVRCAFWLGMLLMNAGERARAGGWMARGERLVNDMPLHDSPEKVLFLLPKALQALSAGHAETARKHFEEFASTGEQYDDIDLIAIGRLGLGQSLIQMGNIPDGIRLLDEIMITVETEDVNPIAAGIVYCAVIETCRDIWDLRRAREWTTALSRWCESQPDIIPFRGQCMVRRAEINQFHGDWHRALEQSASACEILTRPPVKPAAGEAFYRKAELCRLLGDFNNAEDCYREAAKIGRTPQPGLALLRFFQGQEDAAKTSVRNTLKETRDTKKRAELLPVFVQIMAATREYTEAREAAEELDQLAGNIKTPYFKAISSHCQGAVFLVEGELNVALEHLHDALKIWNTLQLPYESARTRELKGIAYLQLNDHDSSSIEFVAAKWIYEQLKAKPDLTRINRVINRQSKRETYGMSLREMQVLSGLMSGHTNREIAEELFISERTVDRHVSNIYKKLDVSSRVEATTFALKHSILNGDFP